MYLRETITNENSDLAAEWGTEVRLCIRIGVLGFAAAYLSEGPGVTPTGEDGGCNPSLTAFVQREGIRSYGAIASLLECQLRTESPANGVSRYLRLLIDQMQKGIWFLHSSE